MTITDTIVAALAPSRGYSSVARLFAFSSVLGLALGLSGCGSDTELNGKIFDLMGVSSAAQAASKSEPKMAARTGLVLPPDAARLPEPGSGNDEAATAAIAVVDDPDRKRIMAASERARLHKAYCSGEMNWKEKARDKDYIPKSPYGPCGLLNQ